MSRNGTPWFSVKDKEEPASYKPLFSLSRDKADAMMIYGFGEVKSTISGFVAVKPEDPERLDYLSGHQNIDKPDEWEISLAGHSVIGVVSGEDAYKLAQTKDVAFDAPILKAEMLKARIWALEEHKDVLLARVNDIDEQIKALHEQLDDDGLQP